MSIRQTILILGCLTLFLTPMVWGGEKVEVPAFLSAIDEINAAIQSKGARWVAKETPLSNLALEELQEWGGTMESEPPDMPVDASFYVPLSLPSSFDWTNNGGNFVTSIKNQHYPYSCHACWAFAATAALESKALITFNMPGADLDLSEQILISCSGTGNCAGGGGAANPANFLRDIGTSLESCYPFTATNGDCSQACANWQANTYKIDGWSWVVKDNYADLSAIKNALYTNGPVIAYMLLYDDFWNYGGGVYSHIGGNYIDTHVVLIVGWNDSMGALRCKNSWGTSWGEAGFFWIDYAELLGTGVSEFGRWVWTFGNAIHQRPIDLDGPDLTGAWTAPLNQTCRTSGKTQKCSLKGTFRVTNIGNRDAASTYVKFYLSDDATYEDGDAQLKSVSTGKLKPGKSKAINVNLNLATNQTATGKYIIAVIDKDNLVAEIDETNNTITYGPVP